MTDLLDSTKKIESAYRLFLDQYMDYTDRVNKVIYNIYSIDVLGEKVVNLLIISRDSFELTAKRLADMKIKVSELNTEKNIEYFQGIIKETNEILETYLDFLDNLNKSLSFNELGSIEGSVSGKLLN